MPDLPELPDLSELARLVEGAGGSLEQLAAAERVAADLNRLGDRLIGYFVERARADGQSWADIGGHLGVTRQAAQQRFAPRWASLTIADLAAAGTLARLTARTRRVLDRAEAYARTAPPAAIGPEHLLMSILDDAETLATKAIRALGADPAEIRPAPDTSAAEPSTAAPPFGAKARRVLDDALDEAFALGHNYLGTEHLLLGLLREPGMRETLAVHGIELEPARAAIRSLIGDILRART